MLTFIATLRNKVIGATYTQELQAESIEDARDELSESNIQIVNIRQKGIKAAQVESAYISTGKLKNALAWQSAQELIHEQKMLGEDGLTPKEAFDHFSYVFH